MKTMRVVWALSALLALFWLDPRTEAAEPRSGHTEWSNWRFDWEVKDSSGLALRNVFFAGQEVLYKASLPAIRVKYRKDGCWWDPRQVFCCSICGCGPFADQIGWNRLVKMSECGNRRVCQHSFAVGSDLWLELSVYARIGSYHIYQAWYFSPDGQLSARVFSRGLQCHLDHRHHPYWRLDFDIDGPNDDQVFVHDAGGPDEGWGLGWHKYTNELNDLKNAGTGRAWFLRDNLTGHGAWIIPTDYDDVADSAIGSIRGFSDKDAAPRLYKLSEDVPWPFGGENQSHLGFVDPPEDIQEKDVVFWYVSHLTHHDHSGPDEWHPAGPDLFVVGEQPPPLKPGQPHVRFVPSKLEDLTGSAGDMTVTLTNDGSGPLHVGGLSIGGANATDFAVVAESCSNHTILATQICTITVRFTARGEGFRVGILSVAHDAQGSPNDVPLGAQGLIH